MLPLSRFFLASGLLLTGAAADLGQSSLGLYDEFYGQHAYTDPAAASNLRNGIATGLSFSPPVDAGLLRFMASHEVNLMMTFAGAALPGGLSADSILTQTAALAELAGSVPDQKIYWNLMSEWDQSGGSWVPRGRPVYTGLSRNGAYNRFFNYYLNGLPPLSSYLAASPGARPYCLAALTDYPANTYYAYEMGVDLSLLERAIDELSDISTGVAFARGAAVQYGKQWGIDISTWRTSLNSATQFDDQGNLTGGWSPSYLRRHYYIAYLSGARILRNEAVAYYSANGQLNPFGQMVKDFADFAFNRHPDVGSPVVPTALLIDHFSGFDPKHWIYSQSNSVWYGDIPYSDGDAMINNFLRVAWPNHWAHGLAPGAPFANSSGVPNAAQFRQYLANGGDPRPFEPMTFTRWGDSFDVITSRASLDTLRRYKVIVLLGGVVVDSDLHDALKAWVQQGGVLVMNASQVTAAEQDLAGVTFGGSVRSGSAALWLADGTLYTERPYRYAPVTPVSATVLATNAGSDALITSNTVGAGKVIFTSPFYLQTAAGDQLLGVGTRLFDWLESSYATATVSGPPVEYLVNRTAGSVIVTLLNHSGSQWDGAVTVSDSRPISAVREYTTDQTIPSGGASQIVARVPPYDVRVYGFEFSNP